MIVCKEISFEDDLPWDDLIKKSSTATFFQTRDWLRIWLKHFPLKSKILGVFEGEELIGLAPFSIVNHTVNFLGTTPVLGKEFVSDFEDIIAVNGKEREVWETVLEGVRGQGSGVSLLKPFLEFNFIRQDSPSFSILQELGGKATEVDVAPILVLPKTWDEYLFSLDRHDRHELRRKLRKGEAEGAKVESYLGNPEDIKIFFQLMGRSNEQKRNFLSPTMQSFFQDLFSTFYPTGMLHLDFLRLKGMPIAATLSFDYHNEVLLYNSGFDKTYSYISPGLILKVHGIKKAIEQGKSRYDFLRGRERYKYDLGAKERKLYKIRFSELDQFD